MTDLSLGPAHLALARLQAARLGLSPAVSTRLERIEDDVFRGHWKARRLFVRLALVLAIALLVVLFGLGLVLVRHRFF